MVQEQKRGPQQEADDTSSKAQYRDESRYCSHPCTSPSFSYRSTWSSRGQFFLTSLGYITGLPSICIFPVLCHYHGGSAFLVSVVVLYLLLGAPLLLLEAALGQLARQSPASLFPKLCPLLAGVGLSMCWSTILVSLSEVCLLSWSLLYIYKTADCKLPWSHQPNVSTGSSAAEYYVHNVLRLSPDLNSFGNIRGDILLATVITWVAVAVCLSAGIRKTGRMCYVIPPLTLVATLVLFIQGCLLWDTRVSAAVSPDWVHLTVPQTWLAASVYVYHSLNLGRGGITTIGSFNKEHTNLIRDVGLLCLVHFTWGITIWLTFVCFTLGNGLQLEPYAGPWVLFVSVAKGLAALPHGVPFALLTYSLVFISGLSTLAGNILMVTSSVLAIFPRLQSQRSAVIATICLGIFLLGIPLTSQVGLHLYWLLIHYAVSWIPVLHGLCVVLVVGLCYGHVQFVADLSCTSGIYLKEWVARHLIVLYSSLLPTLLLVLLVSTLHIVSHSPTRQSTYPDWGVAAGWLLTALPLFVLLSSGAAYKLFHFLKKHSFRKSLMLLVKPDEMWIYNTFRTGSRVSEKTTMTSPVIISGCKEYENNNLSSYIDRNLQHGDREQDSFDL